MTTSPPVSAHCSPLRDSSVSATSAIPSGRLRAAPLKMTSSIVVPRRLFADCSPSTHCTASQMLDLPEPFGPTIAVMRDGRVTEVRSTKDLKPWISSLFSRNMNAESLPLHFEVSPARGLHRLGFCGRSGRRIESFQKARPRADAELRKDVLEVVLDGPLGDEEAARDLRVAKPFEHGAHDVGLASGDAARRESLAHVFEGKRRLALQRENGDVVLLLVGEARDRGFERPAVGEDGAPLFARGGARPQAPDPGRERGLAAVSRDD